MNQLSADWDCVPRRRPHDGEIRWCPLCLILSLFSVFFRRVVGRLRAGRAFIRTADLPWWQRSGSVGGNHQGICWSDPLAVKRFLFLLHVDSWQRQNATFFFCSVLFRFSAHQPGSRSERWTPTTPSSSFLKSRHTLGLRWVSRYKSPFTSLNFNILLPFFTCLWWQNMLFHSELHLATSAAGDWGKETIKLETCEMV